MLVQITAPHFCAGLVLHNGTVVTAAPIIAWSIGWPWQRLEPYLIKRRWRWHAQPDPAHVPP